MRRISSSLILIAAGFGLTLIACEPGGIGDPCIPEDEYRQEFGGFSETEINVESRSYQCETRLCLVANFRGRVSCPYGQVDAESGQCFIPGTRDPIQATVPAQLRSRRPDDAVYCSCRCEGPDPNAQYCECPSGFTCQELVFEDPRLGNRQLAGSYCLREGTYVANPTPLQGGQTCDNEPICGPR